MGDFKPQDHIEKIQGKDYLNAQWRLAWFRDVEPEGQITTQIIEHVPGEYALVKAIVSRAGGGVGTGHKLVTVKQFPRDYLGKAETQAIARALGAAGFGTQFAVEFADEDVDAPEPSHVSDSGVASSRPAPTPAARTNAPHSAPQAPQRPANVTTLPVSSGLPELDKWLSAGNITLAEALAWLKVESLSEWKAVHPDAKLPQLKAAILDARNVALGNVPAEASS